MVREWRDAFKEYLKNDLISAGGTVSIEGVTLKFQGHQFLDFTVHHFHMEKNKTLLERPRFSIKDSTILCVNS